MIFELGEVAEGFAAAVPEEPAAEDPYMYGDMPSSNSSSQDGPTQDEPPPQ